MAHYNGSGVLISRGRGGSKKGRHYYKKDCPKCGIGVPSNVFPQHVRKCGVAKEVP